MFEGRNRFYLVLETEADPPTVINALETIAKLGSREILPILIARALSGISLQHLMVPPQELPRRAHCIYFQIEHTSDQWAQVQQSHNLALYWDAAPHDLKMELMIVGLELSHHRPPPSPAIFSVKVLFTIMGPE